MVGCSIELDVDEMAADVIIGSIIIIIIIIMESNNHNNNNKFITYNANANNLKFANWSGGEYNQGESINEEYAVKCRPIRTGPAGLALAGPTFCIRIIL